MTSRQVARRDGFYPNNAMYFYVLMHSFPGLITWTYSALIPNILWLVYCVSWGIFYLIQKWTYKTSSAVTFMRNLWYRFYLILYGSKSKNSLKQAGQKENRKKKVGKPCSICCGYPFLGICISSSKKHQDL